MQGIAIRSPRWANLPLFNHPPLTLVGLSIGMRVNINSLFQKYLLLFNLPQTEYFVGCQPDLIIGEDSLNKAADDEQDD